MWPFSDYQTGSLSHQYDKNSGCKCGKSDALTVELIKIIHTMLKRQIEMSANSDALAASIAAVDGEVDALKARVDAIVVIPGEDVDALLPGFTSALDELKSKVAAIAAAPAA